jgi:hypothetical protein
MAERTVLTEAVLSAIGGDVSTRVWRARRTLKALGIDNIELHPIEIEQIRLHQEQARIAAAGARQLLAEGPLPPECDCSEDENGLVINVVRCRWGHLSGRPKFRIEEP